MTAEVINISVLRKRRFWLAMKKHLLFGEPIRLPITDEILRELRYEFEDPADDRT